MRWVQILTTGLMLVTGTSAAGGHEVSGLPEQVASSAEGKSYPESTVLPRDVYPETGNRLPPVKREELDDYGKQVYDRLVGANPSRRGGSLGHNAIDLHSPKVADLTTALIGYLRNDIGLDNDPGRASHLRDIATLVVAREMNNQVVWLSQERFAEQDGVEQRIVDIVKRRGSVSGLGEKEAVIIEFGRQLFGQRKVSSDTFAKALKLFGRQSLVNLVRLMINYSDLALLFEAFDMQLPPGQKSLLPVP